MSAVDQENPLLKDFDFPPFDCVSADHVRPGVRALLKKVVSIVSLICLYSFCNQIIDICACVYRYVECVRNERGFVFVRLGR